MSNWVSILAFGIVTMFVPIIFSKKLNDKNLKYSKKISKLTQLLKEYFIAYPTIKNYSVEKAIIDKFDKENIETEDCKFEADYTISLANSVGSLLSWFMQFIGVGLGIMLVIKGEILIGTVIATQSFANDLAVPLQNIIVNFNSIRSVKDIVLKLEALSEECDLNINDVDDELIKKTEDYGRCDITFKNLNLKIDDKKIIDNFSFDFISGKKYLIVGLNGSGKSTIFKSLKKWFNNCTGTILVNKIDYSHLTSDDLSRLVSYLNENVSLFSGSIKDNITLFRDCKADDFEKAIKTAHVKIDLNRMVSDEGRNISSGEQRRIEIARSLLDPVQVLIFDEVISTLDVETAYEIEKLVLGLKDKTVIFISHNFSGKLIKEYDEILVVGEGKLVASGTYEQLINNCQYFRNICEIKFGGCL